VPEAFEKVRRMDASALLRAVHAAGGPTLAVLEPLSGGEVGAWLVRWPDGHHGVLTWFQPPDPGQPKDQLARLQELQAIARGAGLPVPRYEAVIDIGALGAAVLQERAPGGPPVAITSDLVDSLLAMAEVRRGLLNATPYAAVPMPLYLASSGPGFCMHEPLRSYSARSRALLERIETLAPPGDHVIAEDLVHLDYHLGNVLVSPDDPGAVTGIVDWDGARAGPIALDLAILAFDLTRRSPGPLQERVEHHLIATTEPGVADMAWAHASLRLVDWSIRHYGPREIEHWLAVSERYLHPQLSE
jgi:Phosphotransferase enzyme family